MIGLAALVGAYLAVAGPLRRRWTGSESGSGLRQTWFLLGVLVIFFALVSPLDELGDAYLFSAHMVQHLILTLVVPPLLLLGTPGWMLRPLLRYRPVARAARVLTSPIVAFGLFNAVFLAWHLPTYYEATLHDEAIHILEHLLFMATGVLNWWPILSPVPELPRLPAPAQILYLFLDAIPSTVLGGIIVFAAHVLYPTYAAAPRLWGIDAMEDQQISGVIMSMSGAMVYLIALMVVFFAWAQREERAERDSRSPV